MELGIVDGGGGCGGDRDRHRSDRSRHSRRSHHHREDSRSRRKSRDRDRDRDRVPTDDEGEIVGMGLELLANPRKKIKDSRRKKTGDDNDSFDGDFFNHNENVTIDAREIEEFERKHDLNKETEGSGNRPPGGAAGASNAGGAGAGAGGGERKNSRRPSSRKRGGDSHRRHGRHDHFVNRDDRYQCLPGERRY